MRASQLSSNKSIWNAEDTDLIPGSKRSPWGGNGNPGQYSCLGNPMDREPDGLQSVGSHRIGHDLETKQWQLCKLWFLHVVFWLKTQMINFRWLTSFSSHMGFNLLGCLEWEDIDRYKLRLILFDGEEDVSLFSDSWFSGKCQRWKRWQEWFVLFNKGDIEYNVIYRISYFGEKR